MELDPFITDFVPIVPNNSRNRNNWSQKVEAREKRKKDNRKRNKLARKSRRKNK